MGIGKSFFKLAPKKSLKEEEVKLKKLVSHILIPLFVLLVFVLGVWIYAEYNIASYSVYYAQHMPHGKDTDPVMATTLDNLLWLERPEIEGYRYDFDGGGLVGKDRERISVNSDGYSFVFPEVLSEEQANSSLYSSYESSYEFSSIGKFLYYIPGYNIKSRLSSDSLRKNAEEKVKNLLAPIIDSQPTHGINLQWYFNWKYQKRFE